MKNSGDYTKFLNPKTANAISSLELRARLIVEGFMLGLHKSPYRGFSAEFSDHMPYMPGESLKNIDWKVYAKIDKFFVKRFEEETNLKAYIIIDASSSMNYKSGNNISKLDYAISLASSFLYILINQSDAAGIVVFSDEIKKYYPPKASKFYLKEMLSDLSNLKLGEGICNFDVLNKIAASIKRRGLIIFISDFLDDKEQILRKIKLFSSQKNETIAFQILDPSEIYLNYHSETIFVDMETKEKVSAHTYHIKKAYYDAVLSYISSLRIECSKLRADFNLIETGQSFDKALVNYFKKRELLK